MGRRGRSRTKESVVGVGGGGVAVHRTVFVIRRIVNGEGGDMSSTSFKGGVKLCRNRLASKISQGR